MRHPLLEDADALTEATELLEDAMHQGCPTIESCETDEHG